MIYHDLSLNNMLNHDVTLHLMFLLGFVNPGFPI